MTTPSPCPSSPAPTPPEMPTGAEAMWSPALGLFTVLGIGAVIFVALMAIGIWLNESAGGGR